MTEPTPPALACPFCGSEVTDRIDLEGKRFLVFRCLFTPEVDPTLSDAEVAERLRTQHGSSGGPYFRGMCDRLHGYVTRGEGARILKGPTPGP